MKKFVAKTLIYIYLGTLLFLGIYFPCKDGYYEYTVLTIIIVVSAIFVTEIIDWDKEEEL